MMDKMLKTTCGVLITDGANILICHPTNGKWWDIPKGQQDPGETLEATAIRELREETGVVALPEQLQYLGTFDYRPKKNLAVFRMDATTMPDPAQMQCLSMFTMHGKQYPEMDAFKIVTYAECLAAVNPNMQRVLSGLI
jgi:ADP-ribose pyrophosphatase YjhB (NUDIX family)